MKLTDFLGQEFGVLGQYVKFLFGLTVTNGVTIGSILFVALLLDAIITFFYHRQ